MSKSQLISGSKTASGKFNVACIAEIFTTSTHKMALFRWAKCVTWYMLRYIPAFHHVIRNILWESFDKQLVKLIQLLFLTPLTKFYTPRLIVDQTGRKVGPCFNRAYDKTCNVENQAIWKLSRHIYGIRKEEFRKIICLQDIMKW